VKEQVEEIDGVERKRLWEFIFLRNTKLFSFGGTKIKNVLEEVFEDLYEIFKFNQCTYNILKIKNT